ncbi:MAG: hypothetical protein WC802_02160 [Patescibacteria group bacterium]|jgi:hypothetical protein
MANAKNNLAKPKAGPPTQRYLDIAEIREDCVVLKDGTLRSVLLVSSINFALKSEDEQQATIQGYMQFLNGLDHPIQITIQSRRMNIDAYMGKLKAQEETIPNELLRGQIRDYMSFVKELVELGEIMQKRFFVIIPYDPAEGGKQHGFFQKLSAAISPAAIIKLNAKQFGERKEYLMQRVGNIAGGLQSMGLQAIMLDTQGLIELYYNSYNPDVSEVQKLAPIEKIQVETRF